MTTRNMKAKENMVGATERCEFLENGYVVFCEVINK